MQVMCVIATMANLYHGGLMLLLTGQRSADTLPMQ